MRVTVMGSADVGLVTGACLSDWGFKVVCLHKDEDKIEALPAIDIAHHGLGRRNALSLAAVVATTPA
jgi:UDPglucose 6-dehydrogenase